MLEQKKLFRKKKRESVKGRKFSKDSELLDYIHPFACCNFCNQPVKITSRLEFVEKKSTRKKIFFVSDELVCKKIAFFFIKVFSNPKECPSALH